MKIVIDIPEEMYDTILSEEYAGNNTPEYAARCIQNGTPLPKGHGRLIDAGAIKPIKVAIVPMTYGLIYERGVQYEWIYMKNSVDNAPTIIEADRRNENADSD